MKRADISSSSEMYFRDNTPIPFPEAGLKESEDEEEDVKTEEAGTEQEAQAEDSIPPTTGNPPTPIDGS